MIEPIELAPDYSISRLIRGGWQQHAARNFDAAAEADILDAFVEAGLTAFETADSYRHLDEALRLITARRRARGATAPRLHTRITLPARVGDGLTRARSALGCGRLDLVQLQSWRLDEVALVAAALRLEEARAQGALLHHGLMNVDAGVIEKVRAAGARPLTVQIQASLLDRRAFATLAPYAMRNGLRLLAYGPLAGGFLSGKWLGRPDPGMTPTAAAPFHVEYRVIIEAFGGWALFQRLLGALAGIAAAHRVSLSCVALRWLLDRPGVAATLIGASSPERIDDWRRAFAITLSPRDGATIDEVLADSTGPAGPVGGLERDADGPFARAIAAHSA